MDPGELLTPHHITHCHRLALLFLPLRKRQSLALSLPHHCRADVSPWHSGHSVAALHRLASCGCGWLLPRAFVFVQTVGLVC